MGMNGSGTTMLLDRLGQHPELFAFPRETQVLPFFLRTEDRYGNLEEDSNFRRLWEEMRSVYAFQTTNKGQPVELPNDWRDTQRSAAAVFDRLIRVFASRTGKVRWAEKTGPATAAMVQTILERRAHPQQGFRSCLGILRLGKSYSNERLEAACRRALTIGSATYKSVASILKHNLDTQPLPEAASRDGCPGVRGPGTWWWRSDTWRGSRRSPRERPPRSPAGARLPGAGGSEARGPRRPAGADQRPSGQDRLPQGIDLDVGRPGGHRVERR